MKTRGCIVNICREPRVKSVNVVRWKVGSRSRSDLSDRLGVLSFRMAREPEERVNLHFGGWPSVPNCACNALSDL